MGRHAPSSPESLEDAEEYKFAYSATLRIFGNIDDFDAISRELRLEPTHTHRRGDRPRPTAAPYKEEMWSYTAPVDRSEPLGEHIDALWARLKPHKQFLLTIKQSLTVDIFLGYHSDCDHAGVEVPPSSLEVFTQLGIPFSLSIVLS